MFANVVSGFEIGGGNAAFPEFIGRGGFFEGVAHADDGAGVAFEVVGVDEGMVVYFGEVKRAQAGKVCLLLPVCGDGCPYNRIKCDTEDTEITNNNIKLIKPI